MMRYLLSSKVCSSQTIVSLNYTFKSSLIPERSYFVLDSESDLVHFFKKTNQTKPYQTLSLYSGIVMNDMNNEQHVVEKISGKAQ